MKRIVCTVTSDLNYDQRMIRICTSLVKGGYDVTLVGRKRSHSKSFSKKPFKQVHLNGWFESGFLFYAEYNIKLFFYLLTHRFNYYNACDLDTIMPCTIMSLFTRKPLVYDAHEYFTEQEEIVSRPRIKRIWKAIEQFSVPKAAGAYTVSKGYAKLFEEEYPTSFKIVRNATRLASPISTCQAKRESYILYQGAVNHGRGLEVLVQSMKFLPHRKLVICGLGDIYQDLIELSKSLKLTDRIEFKGYVEPNDLKLVTQKAALGITFFGDGGLSHRFSLANRFFDYMHAGVPQLAMHYPEYELFNKEFEIAHLLKELTPEASAKAIETVINNEAYYNRLQKNALKARELHNFQEDEKVLLSVYNDL